MCGVLLGGLVEGGCSLSVADASTLLDSTNIVVELPDDRSLNSEESSLTDEFIASPTDEFIASPDAYELDSIQSGHEQIIETAGTAATSQYWDHESDDNSFMPRKPPRKPLPHVKQYVDDWENLDDESTVCLDSTEDTASLTEDDSTVFSTADFDSLILVASDSVLSHLDQSDNII
jgi:hypothetical protein